MGEPTELAVRELTGPAARRLAELTAVFDDLQFVLGCGERLLRELARGDEQDPVVVEALWAAALNAYARCFRPGEYDARLTVDDLAETRLQGDLVQWHELLGKLRNFLVAKAANPREAFSVGVTLAADGPAGVVVSSVPRPQVDEASVRQTGRIAFELGQVVNRRIQDQQAVVFAEVKDLPAERLNRLEPLAVDMSVATAENS
jgi:hypothetical protein